MTSNDNGSRLKWKVLTKTRQSSVRPTGKESLNWIANSVALIYGSRDAVLVDTFLFPSEARGDTRGTSAGAVLAAKSIGMAGMSMRLSPARKSWKEIHEADHVARRRSSDHQRASCLELDQRYSTEDERAHDAFAEVSLLDDERANLFGRDQQRFDVPFRATVGERRGVVGERAELSDELSRSLIGDRRDAPQTVARGDHLVLSSLTFAFGELYPLAVARTENATAATTHRRSPRCGLGR